MNKHLRSAFMKALAGCGAAVVLLTTAAPAPAIAANESAEVWLTDLSTGTRLAKQANLTFGPDDGAAGTSIVVDENTQYQQMDGFGASITDASAWLLNYKLTSAKRAEVMEKLFGQTGIGLSLLRQTIGASDFNWEIYSYNETAGDTAMNNFSIARDMPYIVPMVKQARGVNPNLKVMAAAWSPPGWMKKGQFPDAVHPMATGYLDPQYYGAYANYLIKFIQAYQGQGIPIYAISPVNEPGLQIKDYPTTYMSISDHNNFIKNNLGPAMRNAGLGTKIMAYDFNWDNVSFPDQALADPAVNSYVAGTAYHHYGGTPSAMTTIHDKYPNKDIWFTEGGYGSWNPSFNGMMREMIAVPRNWSKSYILWNLALDQNNGPTVLPNSINWGTVTIRSEAMDSVTYNDQYYAIGHFSKFVVPGAHRIASTGYNGGTLDHVAFKNPDGSKAIVVFNHGSASNSFKLVWNGQKISYTLKANSAVTFKWNNNGGSGTAGAVSLKASANGSFVSADNAGADPLVANRTAVGDWEKFRLVSNSDGTVSLQAVTNNKYVMADLNNGGRLIAASTAIGTWEKFYRADAGGVTTLRSAANNQYVTADLNLASPVLYANRATAGGWEQFAIASAP
ncbi:glycoside hydrolase family 30 beta sandwich domain-containing protein [Paenibacillus xanthanilyticus]|uniref:Glycoside hydrolase family 30 beta sandwich domain-containing protein n=1 Tax=Paenibacillus xanthanilyticus TaxID=1783531 RepID=A0ABV8KDM8_9BACL